MIILLCQAQSSLLRSRLSGCHATLPRCVTSRKTAAKETKLKGATNKTLKKNVHSSMHQFSMMQIITVQTLTSCFVVNDCDQLKSDSFENSLSTKLTRLHSSINHQHEAQLRWQVRIQDVNISLEWAASSNFCLTRKTTIPSNS